MSGYLQRLVKTAAGRAEAVHPRTGSIFSPARDDASSPLRRVEESEIVTAAQPRPDQPAPTHVSFDEPPRRVARESVYAPLLPAAEPPAHHAAAAGPPASRAALTGGVEPLARHVLQPDEPPPTRHDAATETPIAPQPARHPQDPVRPLTNANRVGDVAAPSPAPRRMSRERYANRPERQPDDIQIHIGRIEVVAVPPPAPRPPTAPDRSLSLDEYLSRRDRRRR